VKNIFKIVYLLVFLFSGNLQISAAEKVDLLKTNWSFKGLFGKFDRGSLQRGYQVYTEVCSSCHSMKYVSYRNLFEPGGPEFTEEQVKAIAASFEITDGPNNDGEMFVRPAKLSDKR
jgi:ubiquinol-cytochrome c reductase cytochrome c1 subunit